MFGGECLNMFGGECLNMLKHSSVVGRTQVFYKLDKGGGSQIRWMKYITTTTSGRCLTCPVVLQRNTEFLLTSSSSTACSGQTKALRSLQ